MQLNHKRGPRRRRRLAFAAIGATAVLGGSGVSIAVALSSGQGPLGEPLPTETSGASTAPTVSGPEVTEAAAISAATTEARAESAASSVAASQVAATPQAVAHTTRKIATNAIGQGQEPADVSPDVAEWYEGAAYVVSFTGQYVAHDAPVPPGANTPSGHYLTLIVDAYSGKITGYELSNTNNLAPKVAAIAKGS
jgi:hypothetical protein